MSSAFSYTCPHCGGEMNYASDHHGLDSQCPHCQKGIILGDIVPPVFDGHWANNKNWRNVFTKKIGAKHITVIASLILLIVSLIAIIIFSTVHKANLEEKRGQEISKEEAELTVKKEAEEERRCAVIDVQIAKMEADYNAKFAVNGAPYQSSPREQIRYYLIRNNLPASEAAVDSWMKTDAWVKELIESQKKNESAASVSSSPYPTTMEQVQSRYNNMTDFQRNYFDRITGGASGGYFEAVRQNSQP